jgi:SAM-dependent methyltransferase
MYDVPDFAEIDCPVCGCGKRRRLFIATDLNWGKIGTFTYEKCVQCGLVYENPRPAGTTLDRFYPPAYGGLLNSVDAEAEKRIASGVNRYRAGVIRRHLSIGSLFDVGCGSGFFMEHMRREGWQVAGIDSSAEHVRFAQDQLQLQRVTRGAWPEPSDRLEKYDIVSMFHVLEHMPDPLRAVSAAQMHLKPSGLLVIETPNIESWPARLFCRNWVTLDAPRHLVLFSLSTLRRCLETTGFAIEELLTYSPSTIEYSESLRYMLQSFFKRPARYPQTEVDRQSKSSGKGLEKTGKRKGREIILNALHQGERMVYSSINTLANIAGKGCNLFAVARLSSGNR